ncbi:MAG TPA: ATP12 family protein [Rhizomicrobium sp.]|nr:ATP12 family protein [Rhizomicrobium sp.]
MVKRFYKDVSTDENNAVLLDNRPVKTPKGAPFVLPTRELAAVIAEEWRAQEGDIKPETMPLTKLAYAAIDGATESARIAEQAVAYAKSDLLCYRAEGPDDLVIRQARQWGPILDWLAEIHGARLKTGTGIAYVEQPPEVLEKLASRAGRLTPFALVALHTATAITGSLALGLAVVEGRLTAAEAFTLSRLDEDFQAERWGRDAEAEARAAHLRADLEAAERFLRLAR